MNRNKIKDFASDHKWVKDPMITQVLDDTYKIYFAIQDLKRTEDVVTQREQAIEHVVQALFADHQALNVHYLLAALNIPL